MQVSFVGLTDLEELLDLQGLCWFWNRSHTLKSHKRALALGLSVVCVSQFIKAGGSHGAEKREVVRCGILAEREVACSLCCLESFVGSEREYNIKLPYCNFWYFLELQIFVSRLPPKYCSLHWGSSCLVIRTEIRNSSFVRSASCIILKVKPKLSWSLLSWCLARHLYGYSSF